ncbi:MAG: hypothetical protein L0Y79_11945 [Chlorobi bacterium]|nr:hypothetical protein [Chlorobiota bacterium]MCI0716115.1 hypothetical protein [Chlorobiota bacterium]
MRNKLLLSFFVVFVSLFLSVNSYSYPKFAAYTGEKCITCHVNPTGGGMRNLFGVKYSKDNLFFKFLEKANKTTDINPQITKGISVGGDMRLLFVDNQIDTGIPNFNSFFQMQGDLYVNAQVNKYINLVIAPGLYIPSNFPGQSPLPTKYEIYGMVSNLPAGLYFKAGRFIPNFGIKVPEHRAYNRQFNDFYTPYASDAGIEAGISPSYFTLSVGFSNGSSVNRSGQRNNSFDFDSHKQLTVSGDFRWASKKSKYTAGIGGSFLTNPYKYDPINNINALRQMAAGFISIGLFERVAILGELAYNRLDLRDSLATRSDFRTIFGELNARITKGIELKFQYENYDPELGTEKSTRERQRYSFGAVLFPLTGLEIESIFRLVKEGKGPTDDFEIKNDEFQTVFKFYF